MCGTVKHTLNRMIRHPGFSNNSRFGSDSSTITCNHVDGFSKSLWKFAQVVSMLLQAVRLL